MHISQRIEKLSIKLARDLISQEEFDQRLEYLVTPFELEPIILNNEVTP